MPFPATAATLPAVPMQPRSSRGWLQRLTGLFAGCFLLVLLGSCSTNPVTGRSQFMLVPESAAILASGQAYAALLEPLRQEGVLDSNHRLKQRVQAITERIVAQAITYRPETAQWDWQIAVIDEPDTLNAFAMAGGKMAIYTGIIEQLALSDDEVAQIIGHEIAHALSAHSAEKMSVALATNLALVGLSFSDRVSEAALSAAAVASLVVIELPNSRSMESEADRIGIELAARAGFAPEAAASLWQKMAAKDRSSHPVFLSTHPAPEARQRDLTALAHDMHPLYEAALRQGTLPTHPVR